MTERNKSNIKIAVLISGQPRFINFCRPSITSFFADIAEVDYFFNLWDSFTLYPNENNRNLKDVILHKIDQKYIEKACKKFTPKAVRIRSYSKFKKDTDDFIDIYENTILSPNAHRRSQRVAVSVEQQSIIKRLLSNTMSQAFSKSDCADLFQDQDDIHEYDAVFRCRTDLFFHEVTKDHLRNCLSRQLHPNSSTSDVILGNVALSNAGNPIMHDQFYGSPDIEKFISLQGRLPLTTLKNFVTDQHSGSNVIGGKLQMETVLLDTIKSVGYRRSDHHNVGHCVVKTLPTDKTPHDWYTVQKKHSLATFHGMDAEKLTEPEMIRLKETMVNDLIKDITTDN